MIYPLGCYKVSNKDRMDVNTTHLGNKWAAGLSRCALFFIDVRNVKDGKGLVSKGENIIRNWWKLTNQLDTVSIQIL